MATPRDQNPSARPLANIAARLKQRWWLPAAIVAVVAIGAFVTELPALVSPGYVETATLQAIAIPTGGSSFAASVARTDAAATERAIADEMIPSQSFAAAVSQRLTAGGMSIDATTVQSSLAATHSDNGVTVTSRQKSSADTTRLLEAALAEIRAEVASGSLSTDVALSVSEQVSIAVTSVPNGAAVDSAARADALRALALRLAAALGAGLLLTLALWRWGDLRQRDVSAEAVQASAAEK